jgi:hypothetical protein
MCPLKRDDYLVRQVKALAAALARLAGLRISGNLEEARAELTRAYTSVLGTQADLLRRVDSRTAAKLLGSPERIIALAQLLNEEAEQEGEGERGAALRLRAAELGISAARRSPENAEVRTFLREVAPRVDREKLQPEDRALLAEGGY